MFEEKSTARLNVLLKDRPMHPVTARIHQAIATMTEKPVTGPTDVSQFLGLSNSQTAKNWETRGPSNEGLVAAAERGISVRWLKYGDGPMMGESTGNASDGAVARAPAPHERPSLALPQALEMLGQALMAADDLTLDQVRPLLARLVDEPGRAPEIVPRLSALLAGSVV